MLYLKKKTSEQSWLVTTGNSNKAVWNDTTGEDNEREHFKIRTGIESLNSFRDLVKGRRANQGSQDYFLRVKGASHTVQRLYGQKQRSSIPE